MCDPLVGRCQGVDERSREGNLEVFAGFLGVNRAQQVRLRLTLVSNHLTHALELNALVIINRLQHDRHHAVGVERLGLLVAW